MTGPTSNWDVRQIVSANNPPSLTQTSQAGSALFLRQISCLTAPAQSFWQLDTGKWLLKKDTMHQFAKRALLTVSQLYPYGNYENRIICGTYMSHAFGSVGARRHRIEGREASKSVAPPPRRRILPLPRSMEGRREVPSQAEPIEASIVVGGRPGRAQGAPRTGRNTKNRIVSGIPGPHAKPRNCQGCQGHQED